MGIIGRRRRDVRHPEERNVGTCGCCQQPVLYDPETMQAACPCGITRIPRQFLLNNVKLSR